MNFVGFLADTCPRGTQRPTCMTFGSKSYLFVCEGYTNRYNSHLACVSLGGQLLKVDRKQETKELFERAQKYNIIGYCRGQTQYYIGPMLKMFCYGNKFVH